MLLRNDEKRFAICIKESGEYIGNIQLTGINEYEAEFHIFIGEKNYWNKGFGAEATSLLIDYAFNKLKLQCVYLFVNKEHQAAIQLYKKTGFYELAEENGKIRMALYATDKTFKMVSVFMMAYNHEKFIAEALEGIINQVKNFDIEIVVGEDYSTDNTRKILLEYADKYPLLLKLVLHKTNIGAHKNQIVVFNACKGKYIAMCEGDDYWTDPYKLQKQVDFLEANPEYAICFHEAKLLYQDGTTKFYNNLGSDASFNFFDLIETNFITTASCVFRVYDHLYALPDWFKNLSAGDWGLNLLNATKGNIFYMNDCMSVYRIHSGGAWSSLSLEEMCNKGLKVMDDLNAGFNYEYDIYFQKAKAKRIASYYEQLPATPVKKKASFRKLLARKLNKYLRK